jgi:hypothetical protein
MGRRAARARNVFKTVERLIKNCLADVRRLQGVSERPLPGRPASSAKVPLDHDPR